MRKLTNYLTPAAFLAAFLLVGTPSAPGVRAVEAVVMAEAPTAGAVGGCVYAYAPEEASDGSFDDFMCATSVVAGTWAIRSAWVGAALVGMGGVPSAGSFLAAGALGVYSLVVGLVYC
ncbi:MAG: hypothetical protein OXU77_21335 [Gammaproteobacteria bacterium]|nr:hypothetical protein [Gammaproteobacteria bacterium]